MLPSWATSSELLVMLVILALLVREWFSIRRTLREDRAKAERDKP
jgi:hypothetical protein